MARSTYNTRHSSHSALITIKTGNTSVNAIGDPSRTFGSTATRYATIRTLSGKEIEEIMKAWGYADHEITMRAYKALQPEDIITYGSRTFEIVNIINSEERAVDTRVIVREQKNG